MNRGLSLYLDLVRFLAALAVLITHLAYPELSGGMLLPWRAVGNDAVMVFFVLSGLVIAHVSATKEHGLRDYVASRLARLWSVAIPALALTILLDLAGRMINPDAYHAWWAASSEPLWRIVRAVTFTNELWFQSIRPFSNGPYWSLGYEAWYYAIFAALAYLGGWRRLVWTGILTLMAGPKILLLFPVWWLGVMVHRHIRFSTTGHRAGFALFGVSLAGYAIFRGSGLPDVMLHLTEARLGQSFVNEVLHFSNEFAASYVIGPLVALHFIGAHAISDRLDQWLMPWQKVIRWFAQSTFALYLLHYPMLRFVDAVIDHDETSMLQVFGIFMLVTGLCVLIGPIIEGSKGWWKARLSPRHQAIRQKPGSEYPHKSRHAQS